MIEKDRRLSFSFDKLAMSPFTALLMGFTFSFAWTPCVGPALASVLIMTASASTKSLGFILIGVYTLGFILPFLAVGFFTTTVLAFFKSHKNLTRVAVKVGGILMIVMGVLMFTGKMNAMTGYLSTLPTPSITSEKETKAKPKETVEEKPQQNESTSASDGTSEDEKPLPAIDFTLQDQFGKTHSLSDYKGKTIFLNFWGTWCPPCRDEMPDIQSLYETQETEGENGVIILGIAAPNYGREKNEQGIKDFLKENGYTYPVLIDTNAELFEAYGIYSFPTTYMIDRDGNVFGYASGQLSKDMMHSIINQTLKGEKD
jgi:cytochrome c-type biogenesis protein